MFCSKCGNKVLDDFEFCINCGANLSKIKKLEDDESVVSKKKDKTIFEFINKNNKLLIITIGILILIAVVITLVFSLRTPNIEGVYMSLYDEPECEFIQNENTPLKGKYYYLIKGEKALEQDYEVKNRKVIINCSATEKEELEIWKDYLIETKYTYVGKIPSGKTFETICVCKGSIYVFHKNSKFEYIFHPGDVGICEYKGKYQRDGDIITIKYNGEYGKDKLLICKNGVNGNAYYKKK